MTKFKYSLLGLIVMPSLLNAQLLSPKVCTLRASSGISIQQVDQDWNSTNFDCENIEVFISGKSFERHIKPGQLHACKYKFTSQNNSVVSILGEEPGTYDVMVKRFNEESFFQNIKVEWDDTGCDVVRQILEVQFDMSIQAKK